MISVHRISTTRTAYHIEQEAKLNEKRVASARSARKFLAIAAVVFAAVIGAASLHAHRVLAAHVPNNMPENSKWILTGRSRTNYDKLGLWFACWQSTAIKADHCRITDESGNVHFDGDMLPLSGRSVVADKDLQFAELDPERLWVRGASSDMPVPVLPLANGTQLVPVADRPGLQKRLASGQWSEGLRPALPAEAR